MKTNRALFLYVMAYLGFLYLPIALLPMFAFNDSSVIAFPLQGFTFHWFSDLWGVKPLKDATVNSLFIACTTAVASTVLGMFAARASTRYDFPMKAPIMGLIMIPLVLPEIIVAVSILVILVKLMGFNLSSFTVILAHTLIFTPFSVAILNSSFAALDASLEEASIDLGENRASTFRLVTLPLVMPGIIASLLITFTCSLDEFIIAFFLTGAEPTLPVYIFSMLRFPQRLPIVFALGTLLVLLSILLLVVAEIYRRRGVARTGMQDKGGFL